MSGHSRSPRGLAALALVASALLLVPALPAAAVAPDRALAATGWNAGAVVPWVIGAAVIVVLGAVLLVLARRRRGGD